ncbi:hypothetical protein [Leptolyngbya sp. FACHB-36]|nr:hypothetical protein [Leptolyngbya sp. FACHB-36]
MTRQPVGCLFIAPDRPLHDRRSTVNSTGTDGESNQRDSTHSPSGHA